MTKNRFLLAILIIALFSCTNKNQKPNDDDTPSDKDKNNSIVWKDKFGGADYDSFSSVATVSDGVVAVGYTSNGSYQNGDFINLTAKGFTDAIIVKYATDGSIKWIKNFGGSEYNQFNSVTATADGIVAVGDATIKRSGDIYDWTGYTGNGYTDAIIVKFDFNGDVVWKSNFGSKSNEHFYAVTAVSDGYVAVGRATEDCFGDGDWESFMPRGRDDAIIVKYNKEGNVLWKKNFGGSGMDRFNAVTAVSDGVIAVGISAAGEYYGDSFENGDWEGVSAKGGTYDGIVVKFNNDGAIAWKKNFGGESDDQFEGVTTVSDGIIAVGNSSDNSFGTGDWAGYNKIGYLGDAIIVKYDFNGKIAWKKNFGDKNDRCGFCSVTEVSKGIVAVGTQTLYTFLVKCDNNGNETWRNHLGNGGSGCEFSSVTAISDGVFAVGAGQETVFGEGDWEDVPARSDDPEMVDGLIVKFKLN